MGMTPPSSLLPAPFCMSLSGSIPILLSKTGTSLLFWSQAPSSSALATLSCS